MITLHLGRFMPRRGYTLRKETVYSFHHTSPQIISSINN
jgi:hypothetical protein